MLTLSGLREGSNNRVCASTYKKYKDTLQGFKMRLRVLEELKNAKNFDPYDYKKRLDNFENVVRKYIMDVKAEPNIKLENKKNLITWAIEIL